MANEQEGESENDENHLNRHHREDEPFIQLLENIVLWCVKVLAVAITFIVAWATSDVIYYIYRAIIDSPTHFFHIDDLIGLLGSFLAVLVVIEVFMNIIFYLRSDAIHLPLVLSTALTAVARKVIIIDYTKQMPFIMIAMAALILSLGITFWLLNKHVKSLHD